MKKYKLAVLFTQPPFGSSAGREGLDALLAAAAFCEEDELLIGFLYDGVFNLLAGQHPERVLQKDHIASFKLIELYELSDCFVCRESVVARGLTHAEWILSDMRFVSQRALFERLNQADKVLTF
ncbi:sulfurtransferase complex subunit TusC [Glaesserella sp.]|uniref:sulfurtransferase complex subunit TusC n=1 Tax=Glaesserella sp. TaxID=2094731 RepID=UPI00359F2D38